MGLDEEGGDAHRDGGARESGHELALSAGAVTPAVLYADVAADAG